jgi:two-component system nitrate/nitrite response regulator NarL
VAEPLRLLVADDHPLMRDGVVHSLQVQPGWQVVAQADNCEQALAMARKTRPDVALIDLSMPGVGGLEVVRVIAAELPCTRVVVLTASSDSDELLAALKVGARAYVLKGVSALELRDVVQRVAEGESYVPPALAGRVLGEFARARSDQAATALTAREAEVLELLAQGLTNREIGLQLHLAEKTVKHHVTQVLNKLHVRSRTVAALLAQRRGRRGL